MPTCCAFNCNNKKIRKSITGVTFHRLLLLARERTKQWIVNLRRENWSTSKESLICSDHFPEGCFDRTGQTTCLTENAVPTIFNFPTHLLKVTKEQELPLDREIKVPESSPRKLRHEVQVLNKKYLTLTEKLKLSEDQKISALNKVKNYRQKARRSMLNFAVITRRRLLKLKLQTNHKEMQNKRIVKKLVAIKQKHRNMKASIYNAGRQIRRLKRKVKTMADVLDELEKKRLLNGKALETLKGSTSNTPAFLYERMLTSSKSALKTKIYPPKLRSFAMTLQFYSIKAYNFVGKTFHLCLPHPSVIRKRYSKLSCEPGFCKEAFVALTAKVQEGNDGAGDHNIICALMMDEMNIKKHIEWDGKQFCGYVDIGAGVENDELDVATEALVFLVVAINGSWKVPVAYFLVNGLSGMERANLINECLSRLYETGVKIVSLTCDGPSCHISMAKHLGADIGLPIYN